MMPVTKLKVCSILITPPPEEDQATGNVHKN